MFLPRPLIQVDGRRRLTADCERKWERDAQDIIPFLILSLWTTEILIFLPPPMATSGHWRLREPPSNPQTSVRSCNNHETLALRLTRIPSQRIRTTIGITGFIYLYTEHTRAYCPQRLRRIFSKETISSSKVLESESRYMEHA